MIPQKNIPLNFLIFFLAALLFVPFLGEAHLFDWDEVNFAESAREMLVTGDYFRVQINYQPFWEKPPFFIWMQAMSMHVFGISEFAARLPNAVAGIVTLLVIFNIGRKEFDARFGLFWVLAYAGSFLPHLYFKSGIIDPVFNLFIFLSIYQLSIVSSIEKKEKRERLLKMLFAGLFIGMAVLTKGPVAILIAMLSILLYMMVRKSLRVFSFKELSLYLAAAGIISFFWFGLETIKNGPWFIQEFIEYQIRLFNTEDAGHGGPFFYHALVLLVGCFPASLYVLKAFRKVYSDSPRQRNLKLWMVISFLVVLVLFSIVKTKIVHYSSFCYFPITFLAAYTLYNVELHKLYFTKIFNYSLVLIGVLISLALTGVPLFLKFKDHFPLEAMISDEFARANFQADVSWSGYEALTGVIYLIVVIGVAALNHRDFIKGSLVLFFSTLIVIQVTLLLIVPRIEAYVQGSVISFYKTLQEKDVYVDVYGYKSYGQFFYARKPPGLDPRNNDKEWLLHGEIDKPVYMVSKINRDQALRELPQFEKVGERFGYTFYKREAVVGK